MSSRIERESIERRIEEITLSIHTLTLELDRLRDNTTTATEKADDEEDEETLDSNNPNNIKTGDRVVVTSRHKNRRGLKGKVTYTSRCEAYITTIKGDFSVKLYNLRRT